MGLGYLEALRPQPHADVGTPAQAAPHRSTELHRGFPAPTAVLRGPGQSKELMGHTGDVLAVLLLHAPALTSCFG